MSVDELAKEIASNIEDGENNYSFDFGLIVIIGSIIIGVLQLLMKCNAELRRSCYCNLRI